MSAIDQILERYTATSEATPANLKGASFAVADKNGKILYKKAFGGRSFDNDDKMTTDTVCWIASMTKFMTATSAAQCIERGLLKLDTDAGTIAKELKDLDLLVGYDDEGAPKFEKAKNKVTLKELCTHTAGLPYDLFDPETAKWSAAAKRTVSVLDSSLECITIPLMFEPGTQWRYGIGLDWAGQMVERLTGKDLDTYMKENIWSPLGMSDTTFSLSNNKHLYERTMTIGARSLPNAPLTKGAPIHPDPAPIAMGGGGSYSTTDDYIKFLAHMLGIATGTVTDGIMKKETIDLLFKPQLAGDTLASMKENFAGDLHNAFVPAWPNGFEDTNYALAGSINIKDIPEKRRAGTIMWSGMANTHWWIDPRSGICATLFTQVLPPSDATVVALLNELESAVYNTLV